MGRQGDLGVVADDDAGVAASVTSGTSWTMLRILR